MARRIDTLQGLVANATRGRGKHRGVTVLACKLDQSAILIRDDDGAVGWYWPSDGASFFRALLRQATAGA